ncbi:MAG TPA: fibronectin type III domain-containing protein, partial [Actinomycetota bacterium]|nr:fibronectin type III domain-containing protein [Actinomycetota bacterium]
GATISSDGVTIRWKPTAQPAGVDVVGYQVTFEREDPLRVFSADLPADARRIRIPGVYLEPGVEYSAEVLTIDASGNRTLESITLTAE